MDIRTKLILVLVSTALFSMAAFGWISYQLASDLIEEHTSQQLNALAQDKAQRIDAILQVWQAEVQNLANTISIDDLPVQIGHGTVVALANIYDGNAKLLASTHPDQAQRTPKATLPSDAGEAAFHLAAGKTPTAVLQAATIAPAGGSLQVWLQADEIQQVLSVSGIGLGKSLRTQLNEPGDVAADEDTISSTHPLLASPWQILVSMDRADVRAIVADFQGQLRNLGLALSGLVILGGLVFGIMLARPIRTLAETVNRIRHGELTLRAKVQGEDEVAMLAVSFNEFMDQLHRSNDIFQLGSLRVLLAVSDIQQRHLLHELLTNWRMRTTMVNNEQALLSTLDEADEDDPIQLVILDPELIDATSQANSQLSDLIARCDCPVILASKESTVLDVGSLKLIGVHTVLPIPVIASDLMEAILTVMGVTTATASPTDVLLMTAAPHKILLVEDSELIQGVMTGFLERWGHTAVVANDGRAAVHACRHEPFDVILMDLEMPGMDGLDATILIRKEEEQHRTPIVALTARATNQDREACMAAGMDEYLSKPVDPKVLYRVINSYPNHNIGTQRAATTMDDEHSPIDWQVALSLTGGDIELLNDLVRMFPVESAKCLQLIHQALASDDAAELTRAAHTLKGSAGFFGAAELVACALQLEELGRASNIEAARQCISELESQTTRLIDAFDRESPPDKA